LQHSTAQHITLTNRSTCTSPQSQRPPFPAPTASVRALCTPRSSARVPSQITLASQPFCDKHRPSALHPQPRTSNNHPTIAYTMSLPSRTTTLSRDTGSHALQETTPNPVLRLSAPSGVLRLRAEPEERRHIQWAEDVIDNEGMGKKSSKGTCTCTCTWLLAEAVPLDSSARATADTHEQYAAYTTRPAKPASRVMSRPTARARTTRIASQITALRDPVEGPGV
jgi:hypothetical protein